MDIRTKLVFTLVAVALASMAALGGVMVLTTESALREARLRQIDALAAARAEGLEEAMAGWRDRVELVASRTQLRVSLRAFARSGRGEEVERVRRILADAAGSVDVFDGLAVYAAVSSGGEPVLVAAAGTASPPPHPGPASAQAGPARMGLVRDGGEPVVRFRVPLRIDGEDVGVLVADLRARALLHFTRRRTGAEASDDGATWIVARDTAGAPYLLGPRPGEGPPTGSLVALAMEGRTGTYWEGVADPMGVPVWASIATVPGSEWLVVEAHPAAAARAPLEAYRARLIEMILVLGAFAILVGTVLGLRFARPVHALAAAAEGIRAGRMDSRAPVMSRDEVGQLARTFNTMAQELEDRLTDLRQFEMFFEVSLDMLCIAGTDGYFKRVNPAFERIVGWPRAHFLEHPIVDFVHPDDVDRTFREIQQLAEGRPTVSFENRYLRPDGGYVRLRWRAHPEPESGLIYAVAREVHEGEALPA